MQLKRTYLFELHKKLKARMVPFAGWQMPVQYKSIIQEHLAVRKKCGIFDVSHMGEIRVSGEDAVLFLERLTPNRIDDQLIGQIRYNVILNPDGGVKDDVTIFREKKDSFFIIVNASNTEKIWNYLLEESRKFQNLKIDNVSDQFSMIAVQGPESERIMKEVFKETFQPIENLYYYYFVDILYKGEIIRISRTGYTGEDGFELLGTHTMIMNLWEELIEKNVTPCGLGARDSLRLEAFYPLYGHELLEEYTPVESGIGWIVKNKKYDYYGKSKLLFQKEKGPQHIIVPFILKDKGIPREGYKVFISEKEKKEISKVRSGVYSPILEKGIGTVFLPYSYQNSNKEIYVELRNKKIPANIHTGPFIKSSAGKKRKPK